MAVETFRKRRADTVAELTAQTRRELMFADGKAFRWLSAAGAMVVTGITMTGAAPLNGIAAIICWIAVTSGVLSAIALALATYPRCRGDRRPEGAAYFGQIHRAGRNGRLRTVLAAREHDDDTAVAQLYWVSRIVAIKYRFVQVGIVFAVISAMGFAYLVAVKAAG